MARGHPLKVPDRRNADAAGAATMHDLAIDQAAPLSRRTACRDNVLHNTSDSESTRSTADDDSHTSTRESAQTVNNAQSRQSSHQPDTTLAHRAALNRINGLNSKKPDSSDNTSLAASQPVLVTPYTAPGPGPAKKADMGKRRKPSVESSGLPPLESFSFQDILKEIDPEIKVSVDAIAEIYGRSKLSLADEYECHRPPLGRLDSLASPDQSHLEAIQNSRLEPVKESTPGHSRRHSLALVGTSAQPKSGLSSNAIAATSHTTSVTQQKRLSASVPPTPQADTKAALLPYILSWLRNSNTRSEDPPIQSEADPRAAESLHKILGDNR